MRILVTDDHEVVRKGVCAILETRKDMEICGEAANGEEAIKKSLELRPDLVILDITMPVLGGLIAAEKISNLLPAIPILMLSMHAGSAMTKLSRSAGAQGFVTKADVGEVLLKAVDTLLAGGTFFPS
jgi:DNA-binding NarL/FixJ family response regulator